MERKAFLNKVAFGGAALVVLPSVGLVQGCEYRPLQRTVLSTSDIPFLDEIGETIVPSTTSSPGAKATHIGEYMFLMYKDCMSEEEQTIFVNGINTLDNRAAEAFETSFLKAAEAQKLQLLTDMQSEAIAYNLENENVASPLPHYFDQFKGLTISGYFTSKIGMTEARNYNPLPGRFDACIPYSQGDKPAAT